MKVRTTLNTALHMASHTECNGCEIDNFWPQPDGTIRINTKHFEIRIGFGALYGYFEHNELGDECGGGLWFGRQAGELLELTDYDGVAVLPKEVIQALKESRIIVDPIFE